MSHATGWVMTHIILVVLLLTPLEPQPNNTVHAASSLCRVTTPEYTTIQAAIDDPGCTVIDLPSGMYRENISIGRSVIIQGAGVRTTTLVNVHGMRGITVTAVDAVVSLRDLTIARDVQDENSRGGGIENRGRLSLVRTRVQLIQSDYGAALYNYQGHLTIEDSEVSDNSTGAVLNITGNATITHSIINGNLAAPNTSTAIVNQGGLLVVEGSTITNNSGGITSSDYLEGGIEFYPAGLRVRTSTISGNQSAGVIANAMGSAQVQGTLDSRVQLKNSLIARSAGGVNCAVTIFSLGHNLDDGASCELNGASDTSNTDARLAPLDTYGGRLPIHVLLPTSPAIDAGDNLSCPPTDQRDVLRPLDGNGDGLVRCDIGAVEYRADPVIESLAPGSIVAGQTGQQLQVQGVNFAPGALGQWQNTPRPTTIISPNEFHMVLDNADVETGGVFSVHVSLPDGRISNTLPFTITNPVPIVHDISPRIIAQDAITFTMSIMGEHFVPTSQVQWDRIRKPLPTTFVSPTLLRAEVGLLDTSISRPRDLVVLNPTPGGGTSHPIEVEVGAIRAGAIGGGVPTVALHGTRAYIGEGSAISILDVADPSRPVRLGQIATQHAVHDMEVAGQHVYATTGTGGFVIVDVSNPAQPQLIGDYNTPGTAYDIKLVGSRMYLADGPGSGLHIFDISTPARPRLLGQFAMDAYDLDIVGETAYVAAGNNGLQTVDISDPSNLRFRVQYNGWVDQALGVQVVDDRVYVTAGQQGLFVASTNGSGRYEQLGHVKDLHVVDNRAYVVGYEGRLSVLDVINLADIRLLSQYSTGDSSWDVRVRDGLAFVADGTGGLEIINVDPVESLNKIGEYAVLTPQQIELQGSFAYIAGGTHGFHLVNVADPTEPTLTASLPSGGFAGDVAIAGDTALVVNRGIWNSEAGTYRGGSLVLVDVHDPHNPTVLTTYPAASAQRIAIQGNTAFLGTMDSILVLDITSPQFPRLRSEIGMGVFDLQAVGTMVYAVNTADELVVIDANILDAPQIRGRLLIRQSRSIRVDGTTAYVGTFGNAAIVDVSNPDAPRPTTAVEPWHLARIAGIDGVGNRVYTAEAIDNSTTGAVEITDTSNPLAPRPIMAYPLDYAANDLRAAGSLTYVAGGEGGLLILEERSDLPPFTSVVPPSGGTFQAPQNGPTYQFPEGVFGTSAVISYVPCPLNMMPPLTELSAFGPCFDIARSIRQPANQLCHIHPTRWCCSSPNDSARKLSHNRPDLHCTGGMVRLGSRNKPVSST